MSAIIEFEHLYFSYQNLSVLTDVSLKIASGEFVGLIGPNGGGKTTLLKLMMGFIKPTKGKLLVFGEPPKSDGMLGISYVPQTVRFDREFPISVLEVVLSGLLSNLPWYGHFHQKDRHAAIDMLEKVGLKEFADKAFGTLSGGQAQRVLIARALVSKPKLLLLDEPTASVDNQAELDIYSILKELKGKMTMIMVTHDLNTAVDQVERLFFVNGKVASLKPEQVCEHFAMGLYHAPLLSRGEK